MKLINSNPAPLKLHPKVEHISLLKDFGNMNTNLYILNSLKSNLENLYLTCIKDESLLIDYLFEYDGMIDSFMSYDNYEIWNFDWVFQFTKNTWLIGEFIKNKKFDNPCGSFWNPRIEKIVVHPGGQRIKTLQLFDKVHEHKFFFWNTNEIKFNWLDDGDIIELKDTNSVWKNYNFGLMLDHGSPIPQVVYNDIYNHLEFVENYYKETLLPIIQKLKIYYKFECKWLAKFKTNTPKDANLLINLKNENKKSIYKAVFISFLDINYDDEDIQIIKLNNS